MKQAPALIYLLSAASVPGEICCFLAINWLFSQRTRGEVNPNPVLQEEKPLLGVREGAGGAGCWIFALTAGSGAAWIPSWSLLTCPAKGSSP